MRLPNGSSKATNSRTRRDRASAAEPRRTASPERSSSVSAASSASESATVKPEAITPDGPLDERQAVVAVIGAQVRDALVAVWRGQLQTDDLGREPGGGVEIGRPGPHVGDVGEGDHGA